MSTKPLLCALAVASLFGCDKPAVVPATTPEVVSATPSEEPAPQAAATAGGDFCNLFAQRSQEMAQAFRASMGAPRDEALVPLEAKRDAMRLASMKKACTEVQAKEAEGFVACMGDSLAKWPEDLIAAMKEQDPAKRDPAMLKMVECSKAHRDELGALASKEEVFFAEPYFAMIDGMPRQEMTLGEKSGLMIKVPAHVKLDELEGGTDRYGLKDSVDVFNKYAVQMVGEGDELSDDKVWQLVSGEKDAFVKKGDDFKVTKVAEGMYTVPFKTPVKAGTATLVVSKDAQDGKRLGCVFRGRPEVAKLALKDCMGVSYKGKTFTF